MDNPFKWWFNNHPKKLKVEGYYWLMEPAGTQVPNAVKSNLHTLTFKHNWFTLNILSYVK